jgi:hypothetical protein
VEHLLAIMLRPQPATLRELYHNLAMTRINVTDQTGPLLLECLARDAEVLSYSAVTSMVDLLLRPTWSVSPHLRHLAQVVAVHPQLLTRDQDVPWAHLADDVGWTRLLTAAALARPGPWPSDLNELFLRIGELAGQQSRFVELIPPLSSGAGALDVPFLEETTVEAPMVRTEPGEIVVPSALH